MEQLCFSVGSCLVQPCQSLRPKPSLPTSFDLITQDITPTSGSQALLCSYLNLADYKLYYEAYNVHQGVRNCWERLDQTEKLLPETKDAIRVWEEIGFVSMDKAQDVLMDYADTYAKITSDATYY